MQRRLWLQGGWLLKQTQTALVQPSRLLGSTALRLTPRLAEAGAAVEATEGGGRESAPRRPKGGEESLEDVPDSEFRGRPWVWHLADMDPDNYAPRLSDATKSLIWGLHKENPQRWTVERLAADYRIRKQRALAILVLKELEERAKQELGPEEKLDDTAERTFERVYGVTAKGEGDQHNLLLFKHPDKVGWSKEQLQAASAEEDAMMWAEFEQRIRFTKKQLDGEIVSNRRLVKRPKEGWSYMIEELGPTGSSSSSSSAAAPAAAAAPSPSDAALEGGEEKLEKKEKKAKKKKDPEWRRSRPRVVAEPSGLLRPLTELEKEFVLREKVRPRRRIDNR